MYIFLDDVDYLVEENAVDGMCLYYVHLNTIMHPVKVVRAYISIIHVIPFAPYAILGAFSILMGAIASYRISRPDSSPAGESDPSAARGTWRVGRRRGVARVPRSPPSRL